MLLRTYLLKLHAVVSIQLSIVACPIRILRNSYETVSLRRFYYFPMSLSLRRIFHQVCHGVQSHAVIARNIRIGDIVAMAAVNSRTSAAAAYDGRRRISE